MGVEEEVEQRVEARRQGQHHQEHGLDDLLGHREEAQQWGECQEGHGAVEQAVGEDEPGHVLDHGAVPDAVELALHQVPVELDVGAGDDEEAEGVHHDEGHHEAQCGWTTLGQGRGQAEGRRTVLTDLHQRQGGHGHGEQHAGDGGRPHAAERRRLAVGTHTRHRHAALDGRQCQEEDGRLRGEDGDEARGLAGRAWLPAGTVLWELAKGQHVHHSQRARAQTGQEVGPADGADDKLDRGEVGGRPEDADDQQAVAHEGDESDGPHSQAHNPAIKHVVARLEGTWQKSKVKP